jgi:hypothetical protein
MRVGWPDILSASNGDDIVYLYRQGPVDTWTIMTVTNLANGAEFVFAADLVRRRVTLQDTLEHDVGVPTL